MKSRELESAGYFARDNRFGRPFGALITVGAGVYLSLCAGTFVAETLVQSGVDALERRLGATHKTVKATFEERVPFYGPSAQVDVGRFLLDCGRRISVNDLKRPLEGKLLSNRSLYGLIPGRQYTLHLVGPGDEDCDTIIRIE